MSNRTWIIALATCLVALVPLTATATANDADVERGGTCTGSTSAEIKLSPEDGGIETEFEVDQNRSGVVWQVVLRRNGSVVTRAQATTRGPSGSFELRRVLADGQGSDSVSARAVSPSGEVCTAHASI